MSIYLHRGVNLSGETIEARIDLGKVEAITHKPGEIVVYFTGRNTLTLADMPTEKATSPEHWRDSVRAAYDKLVAAWEAETRKL